MIGEDNMDIGLMTYDNVKLSIINVQDSMWFPCDNLFAGKIMSAVREAYKLPDEFMPMPTEFVLEVERLSKINTADATKAMLKLEGYTEVGYTDDITLFVKCMIRKNKLFAFKYVSDKLPNTHGSTQVNITVNI